ncbi:Ig-like domain-containing protein [Flammeovirga aprica]|uniref:BIG2 domain-containing protein n=1 Tax=Flammeovirga aprica JL-4 TaxID=694437 RepID=A0A7X9XB03_9BACT|nr:Ig-like domain-containing protein [Flammeovirga aprica]NME70139.1 hypothetical protein [Flammeovirga aprica JL-4]
MKHINLFKYISLLFFVSLIIGCQDTEEKDQIPPYQGEEELRISPWQLPFPLRQGDSLTFMAYSKVHDEVMDGVSWRVLNHPEVLSIDDKTGEVIGLQEGYATVVATNEITSQADTSYVVVAQDRTPVVTVSRVLIKVDEDTEVENIGVPLGRTTQIGALTVPYDIAYMGLIRYYSEDPSIATVDQSGKISGKKLGTTFIGVETLNEDGDRISDILIVEVTNPVPLTSITVKDDPIIMFKDITAVPEVSYLPENGSEIDFLYFSTDKEVLDVVEEKTLLKPLKAGETSLFISNGKISAGPFNVKVIELQGLSIRSKTGGNFMKKSGQYLDLECTTLDGSSVIPNKNLEWTSSDESVLVVDENGIVRSVTGDGTATVTVRTIVGEEHIAHFEIKVQSEIHYFSVDNPDNINIPKEDGIIHGGNLQQEVVVGENASGEQSKLLKLTRKKHQWADINIKLEKEIDLRYNGLFSVWVKVEDPGREVTYKNLEMRMSQAGENPRMLRQEIRVDPEKYGQWVRYVFDFSGVEDPDDRVYTNVIIHFAYNDLDYNNEATTSEGMVFYVDKITGPHLRD